MKITCIAIIFALTTSVFQPLAAQDEEEINVVGYRFLDYQSGYMPDKLLSGKTAVLVSVPPKPGTSIRGDWKGLSKSAHSTFADLGVDAVKYYYLDDIMAGPEVTEAVAEEMTQRGIDNLIVLSRVALKIAGKDTERFVVVVTPYNGKASLIDNGQPAWKDQNKNLDKVLKKFTKSVSRSGLNKENLLVLDRPEFFEGFDIITKKRFKSFPRDLRIDKLAIPVFDDVEIPGDIPGGALNNRIRKDAEQANRVNDRLNTDLKRIFEAYPYEKGFVEHTNDSEALRRQGYHYILLKLNTSGEMIRKFLGYEPDDMSEEFVTVKKASSGIIMRRIPKKAPVYKYYIKHIYSGDIYLGERWDADETWRDALKNFMDPMIEALKD